MSLQELLLLRYENAEETSEEPAPASEIVDDEVIEPYWKYQPFDFYFGMIRTYTLYDALVLGVHQCDLHARLQPQFLRLLGAQDLFF